MEWLSLCSCVVVAYLVVKLILKILNSHTRCTRKLCNKYYDKDWPGCGDGACTDGSGGGSGSGGGHWRICVRVSCGLPLGTRLLQSTCYKVSSSSHMMCSVV